MIASRQEDSSARRPGGDSSAGGVVAWRARSLSFLGSLALHGLVGGGVVLAGTGASSEEKQPSANSWSGDTFEVQTEPEDAREEARSAALGSEAEAEAPPSNVAALEPKRPLSPEPLTAPSPSPSPEPGLARAPAVSPPRADPAPTPALPVASRPPSPASEGESSSTDGARAPEAGAFGSRGLPPGVRDLGSSFTRAIPPATSRDPMWASLPLGRVGAVRLRLVLDGAGRVESSEILRPRDPPVPEALERLATRVVALLGRGQFALAERAGRSREQTFYVEVSIEETKPTPDAEPAEVVRLAFDAPTFEAPGRATFTLGSGRRFEALVFEETPP